VKDAFESVEENLGKYYADFVRAAAGVLLPFPPAWGSPYGQVVDVLGNSYLTTCVGLAKTLGISAENAALLAISAKYRFLERESKKLSNLFNLKLKLALGNYAQREAIANAAIAKGRMKADVKDFMAKVEKEDSSLRAFMTLGA
jgi:hypothetical protein